jgi:hypothetical protein
MQVAERIRREERSNVRGKGIRCVPQKVNFTEPKSEKSVRLV